MRIERRKLALAEESAHKPKHVTYSSTKPEQAPAPEAAATPELAPVPTPVDEAGIAAQPPQEETSEVASAEKKTVEAPVPQVDGEEAPKAETIEDSKKEPATSRRRRKEQAAVKEPWIARIHGRAWTLVGMGASTIATLIGLALAVTSTGVTLGILYTFAALFFVVATIDLTQAIHNLPRPLRTTEQALSLHLTALAAAVNIYVLEPRLAITMVAVMALIAFTTVAPFIIAANVRTAQLYGVMVLVAVVGVGLHAFALDVAGFVATAIVALGMLWVITQVIILRSLSQAHKLLLIGGVHLLAATTAAAAIINPQVSIRTAIIVTGAAWLSSLLPLIMPGLQGEPPAILELLRKTTATLEADDKAEAVEPQEEASASTDDAEAPAPSDGEAPEAAKPAAEVTLNFR